MLQPLVRLLLDHGVGFPFLIEMLKTTYVRVADRHFKLKGKEQTDSRLSLLTGVHRKDIKRLRGGVDQEKRALEVPLAAQVLGLWTGDARYLNERHEPRVLPRFSREGGEHSFESLVESVSKDIRPRSLLDEWLRSGVVSLDEDDRVHLASHAAVPAENLADKLEFFGRNVHDHVAAISANLRESPSPFMERCVFYDGLKPEQVAELRALAERRAMEALLEVNRQARSMIESNGDDGKATERFNFGVYFYHEAASDDADQ
ncbi:DUF6502 family protein [Crenobacter sp. SG2305]|uniref:DUF6502 family protein n=1 Tax=Crenobacter oryzisoli TaxID=3056844 RepID=UPI0025AB1124|nr:DUF6502 family protein [Crenobacter sp. SG2305]MDN0083220.1 DUF6502 family protein [Crenobacter sp. SG2305]